MTKRLGLSGISILAILIYSLSAMAEELDVSRIIKTKGSVSVFIKEVVNESGGDQILPDDFKKAFHDVLLNRKAVKFEIAKSPEASDLEISVVIKKYQYLKNDPVTTYASPSGLLLDAVTTENYVMMETEFIVTDTKTGKTLWNQTLSAFIKKMMTPEESIPLIYDKIARTFLWKCFGKPK